MEFTPGTRYRFRPKPGKYVQKADVAEYHARTLTYLRDEFIHHIFRLRGGALECFTDIQAGDYLITKI